MKKHRVQLVLTGHEHHYEHNVLHYENNGELEMHFIVGGGGGVPLRNIPDQAVIDRFLNEYSNNGYEVEQKIIKKIFNYSLVEVGTERLIIKTYEIPVTGEKDVILVEEIVISK